MALAPHRAHVGHVQVRDRLEHHIETAVGEGVQIAHVALHRAQLQAIARGDLTVLLQLPVGQVEHGDISAGRGQYRRLLSTARRQAQDAAAAYIAQPVQARKGTRRSSRQHEQSRTQSSG
ncbi:hypothetical protein G6F23_014728 [Rhizopus arrhizus]|nr:hypothetical protein G6F23_014728 [Rhizopus arrhizus]